MEFQDHFVEAQADPRKRQQTSRQGGYTGGANNLDDIQDAFDILEKVTVEYQVAITNMTAVNTTLMEQVSLYTNHISTKEAENDTLQRAVHNPHGDAKNLKAELSNLKKQSTLEAVEPLSRTGSSKGSQRVKRKGRDYPPPNLVEHPILLETWCWQPHQYNCKNKLQGHKEEATSTTSMGGRKFGITPILLRLGSDAVNNVGLNLVNFSRTENTCSGNPLRNIDTYGIINTGETKNILKLAHLVPTASQLLTWIKSSYQM